MKRKIEIPVRGVRRWSYTGHVEQGMFGKIPHLAAGLLGSASVFILTDSNVKRLYGRTLLRLFLEAGIDAWIIDFPAGERSKNADLCVMLHSQLLEHGVRRDSIVVALGGGVVGDVAGYVAATVLRGIQYVQVPTTLLAQVDSSIGGKVGIDHPLGKNLIGAFHQPSAVFVDPLVLNTLPDREFRSGLAEVVKIGAGLDLPFFKFLEKNAKRIIMREPKLLSEMIVRSVQLKAGIVERDERDTGVRTVLNLGHTIGHAVEGASGYRLRHGEAVAIGLAAESRISRDMGLLSTKHLARLLRLMDRLGLPLSLPRIKDRELFLNALGIDKKTSGTGMKFVLLKRIGSAVIGVDVPGPFINATLSHSSRS